MTARRTRLALLARTALGTALVLTLAPAIPAAAQVSSGGGATVNAGTITGQFTNSGAGGAAFTGATANSGGADVSTVTLGSNRTLLTWNGFNLASNDTLNFVFAGRGDIVLNRVDAGSATINGILNGKIGSTAGATGGNVWFASPGGVVFGSNAVVNVGGLLATTGQITGADFFGGDLSFGFSDVAANIAVDAGAQLNVDSGTLALIAPVISTAAGSTISGGVASNDSDVLFGAAEAFTISFAPDTDGDLDLLSWTVPAAAMGSDAATPIALAGTTSAGNIYLGAVSRRTATTAAINISGTTTANGAIANGDGTIILSAGGGVGSAALGASAGETVNLTVNTIAAANRDLLAAAGGDLSLQTQSSGRHMSLTAGGNLTVNNSATVGGDYSVTADDFIGSGSLAPTFVGTTNDFSVTDTAGGTFFGFGGKTAPGTISVTATNGGGLTINGTLTSTNEDIVLATLGGGDIALQGGLTTGTGAGRAVTLTSSGNVTQTAAAVITTHTLGGSAANAFDLDDAGNSLVNLAAISGNGVRLLDGSNALTLAGTISGGAGGVAIGTAAGLSVGASTVQATGNGAIALTSGGGLPIAMSGATIATGSGTVTLTGPVLLASATNRVSSTGTKTFTGAIDGPGDLLVGNDGLTVFNAAIGATTRVGSLAVTGTTTLGTNTVRASTALSFGRTTVSSPAAASAITIDAGTGSVTFTEALDSNIGAQTLAISGSTILVRDVGAPGAFGSIAFTGNTTLNGTYGTTGTLTVTGDTTLGGDTLLFNGASGASFTGTVDAETAGGASLSLNASGTTSFGGAVGGTKALSSLTTDAAGTTSIGSNVTTTGAQTYGDAVTMPNGSTRILTSTGNGDIGFGSTVNGNTGGLRVTTGGATTFGGSIGGTTPLGLLTVDGGGTTTFAGNVTTSGGMALSDAVMLAANSTFTSTSNASITFGSTVDGAFALSANTTGTTTFAGLVGGTTPLASLSTNAGGTTTIGGGAITTSGAQAFGDGVTLGAAATLTGTTGSFTTVTGGGRDLTLDYSGSSTLAGASFAGIRNFVVGNGGTTTLSGTLATSGTQTFGDALSLGGATALISTGIGDAGDITLGTVTGNGNDLDISASGDATFSGVATGLNRLGVDARSIAVDAAISASDVDMASTAGGIAVGAALTGTSSAVLVAQGGGLAGTGTVTGNMVVLQGQTGIGASSARFNTAASALTANSPDGSVFVNEANGVALQDAGALSNGASGRFDLAAAGTISVDALVSASGVTLTAGNGGNVGFTAGGDITATGADIRLTADGTIVGSSGSTQLTGQNIFLSADDFAGGILADAALQETADVSITDTLGGLIVPAMSAAGSLSVTAMNGGSLVANGATSGGTLNLTATGDLTLAAGVLTASNALLSTPAAFVNQAGAGAIDTSGRWLVYSADPAGNTFGGLDSGNTAIWNGTPATRAPGTITGNRYVFAQQPTLTFTSTNASKTYGDALTLGGQFSVGGLQPGVANAYLADTSATAFSGAPALTSAGAAANATVAGGPYAINIAPGTLTSSAGYALAFAGGGQLGVTPKALTATLAANNKTYDGNTTATGSVALGGVVGTDVVAATGAAFAFVDRNAGTGKTVTVTGATLTGADAGNYTLTLPGTVVADILQRAISATAAVDNKSYDGGTAATGTLTPTGLVAGDAVTASGTFAFADKHAGFGKTVTISGVTIGGADAGNYVLTVPASALADILPKALTATVAASSKAYDGTTATTGSVTLEGVVVGDAVATSGGSFAFVDGNAGTAKTVTVSGVSLGGADAGNYTLVVPASVVADIMRRAITVTADARTKTAGTADPALTFAVTSGALVAGDALGGSLSRAAGEAAGVYAIDVGTLSGLPNYELTFVGSTLTIRPAPAPAPTPTPTPAPTPDPAPGPSVAERMPESLSEILDRVDFGTDTGLVEAETLVVDDREYACGNGEESCRAR